jgi:uncharacterized protein YbdZ (MbtH family)
LAGGQLRFPAADDSPAAERLEADAAGFGFYVVGDDRPVEEQFYLWPENCGIWELWLSVQTQWHTDNGIRTRLDYTGVQVVMNNHPIGKNRLTYFKTLQAMEFAALDEWAKQR